MILYNTLNNIIINNSSWKKENYLKLTTRNKNNKNVNLTYLYTARIKYPEAILIYFLKRIFESQKSYY